MNVIRADVLGFCMGVRRAFDKTLEEAKKKNGSRVITLGSLVHNPAVLNELKKYGVETLNTLSFDLSELKDSAVIIRAHGISPEFEKELINNEINVIDATCPKVKKSQLTALKYSKEGYGIFLAGDDHHAEIEGICGYAKAAVFCKVVGTPSSAREFILQNLRDIKKNNTVLIGQTTISEKEYNDIASAIKEFFPDLIIENTICSATMDRQIALKKLLDNKDIEAIIIAGGKESANTRRLFTIAEESGLPCCLVESVKDLPCEFLNYKTIGLSAGASTPDSVIDDIEQILNRMC